MCSSDLAVYDRTCRLLMDYQGAAEEAAVVVSAAGGGAADDAFVAKVVELVRLTRSHPDLRIGSSVRGAIDMVLVAGSLGSLRDRPVGDRSVSLDAALAALSGRVRIRDGSGRASEEVIRELFDQVFAPTAGGGGGKG